LETQTTRPGTLRLEGVGTQWVNKGDIYVGGGGTDGSLVVSEGATLTNTSVIEVGHAKSGLVYAAGGMGEVLVEGSGSVLETRNLSVGWGPEGDEDDMSSVTIASGGQARMDVLSMEDSGLVLVSGPQSIFEVSTEIDAYGGSLMAEQEGTLRAAYVYLGYSATLGVTSTGKVVIGSSSSLPQEGAVVVGDGGYLRGDWENGAPQVDGNLVLRDGAETEGFLAVSGDFEQSADALCRFGGGELTSDAFGQISIGGDASIQGYIRIDIFSRWARPGVYTFDLFTSDGNGAFNFDPDEVMLTDYRFTTDYAQGQRVVVPSEGDGEVGGWSLVDGVLELEITSLSLAFCGDANDDGVVDDQDASVLAENWHGDHAPSYWSWQWGDFNGDGAVDEKDASIMASHWHESVESSAGNVPEPTPLAMLAGAVAAMGLFRRRRMPWADGK